MLAGPPAIDHGSTSWWPGSFCPLQRRVMTFMHKLARRLARLKGWTPLAATVAVAVIFGCEVPLRTTDTGSSIAQLVISPKNVTLQPNQAQDFMAVGFTATGDSADIAVTWSASGGSVASSSV